MLTSVKMWAFMGFACGFLGAQLNSKDAVTSLSLSESQFRMLLANAGTNNVWQVQ